jgi:hypothetical protein
MLTQEPKGQLQIEHEWKKETTTKYKNEAIDNIWVIIMAIKIITKIKIIN